MNDLARARGVVTELKIPAQGPFIVVAKRAASALGSTIGFSLQDIDDLNIAVSQACEKAIAVSDNRWGVGGGILKLTFRLVDSGMEVEIKSGPSRDARDESALQARARQEEARRLLVARKAEAALRAQQSIVREELDLEEVGVNMIRLFVDELRWGVDTHGGVRMRMVKYLVE